MNKFKPTIKTYLCDSEGARVFGEGPYRLLSMVEETGSLRKAASSLGMAYTKAHKIIKSAEEYLGYKLLIPSIGGSSGGGSVLTPECKKLMAQYNEYRTLMRKANEDIYKQVFEASDASIGCVIMASGMSKRYGENKLMADLLGRPLISYVLAVTEGLFDKRIVLTRSSEVADYCKTVGVKVILHNQELRSEAIKIGLMAMETVDSVMFVPGDQPLLTRDSIVRMIEVSSANKDYIVRLASSNKEGAPVIFPSRFYVELDSLTEKSGGKVIIDKHRSDLMLVEAVNDMELFDVDTTDDMKLAREYLGGK